MKRSVATAHELHTHHFRWSQLGINQTLELACGAVLALNVDHAETVINRNTRTLVDGVVKIRMTLPDGPALPQLVLAVINQRSGHCESLCIHMHHTLSDGV